MTKPGPQPPTDPPGEWAELTLESTRTLKARVLVPATRPKSPAAAPAEVPGTVPEAAPASRAEKLNDLFTLESTIKAKARVLPASASQQASAAKPPVAATPAPAPEPPRRARLSTNELHALSIKIKAEREKAELLKSRGSPDRAGPKVPTVPRK